jgi:hypothetical protein
MNAVNIDDVYQFVQNNISSFHESRIKCLNDTQLIKLMKAKNPYLFRAKNMITAQELVTALLDARLSSSEEQLFGRFLEDLALFVANKSLNAFKSSATGIDFEYTKDKTRYLVTVKSGPNWGNSSQMIYDITLAPIDMEQTIKYIEYFDCLDLYLSLCYSYYDMFLQNCRRLI